MFEDSILNDGIYDENKCRTNTAPEVLETARLGLLLISSVDIQGGLEEIETLPFAVDRLSLFNLVCLYYPDRITEKRGGGTFRRIKML